MSLSKLKTSLTLIFVFAFSTSAVFVNINEVAQKNVQVDGQVLQVSENVGLIMCVRKCADLTSCHRVNFHKQNLTCVLLTDQVIATCSGEGWWYVDDVDWLKSNVIEQSQAQCAASESGVKLSSGAQHCVKSIPKDCTGHITSLQDPDGVYIISPQGDSIFGVFCDFDTNSGGPWTVIQRRVDFTVDFFRSWNDYKSGFGNLNRNFWLGNDNLHVLLSGGHYHLRVDVEDLEGRKTYAEYSTFNVAAEDEKYKLTIRGYNGTAGDALQYHDGMKFSTKDSDNDAYISDCATSMQSGWWFKACRTSDLNGNTKIVWRQQKKTASMRVKEKKV